MAKKVALVVGGTGMAACEIVPEILNSHGDVFAEAMVIALDAKPDTFRKRTPKDYTPVEGGNLNSRESLATALKATNPGVTHVFWFLDANRPPHMDSVIPFRQALSAASMVHPVSAGIMSASPKALKDQVYGTLAYVAGSGHQPRNLLWLENIFGALEDIQAPLERFVLGTGGKHYGMHLGPIAWGGYSSPFYEDKTKCPGPLSYFEMEDFIKEEANKKGFTWNVIRPTFIIGNTPELTPVTQSFGIVLAVYALILKAQGLALKFPGTFGNWTCRNQLTTSEKIAQVAVWAAINEEGGANEAFNVTSTPEFSWSDGTWDAVAEYFGMKSQAPKKGTMSGLSGIKIMGGQAEQVWKLITDDKPGLRKASFSQVYNGDFFDKSFTPTWDALFSEDKLIEKGFPKDMIHEGGTAAQTLINFFKTLVADGLIPDPKDV